MCAYVHVYIIVGLQYVGVFSMFMSMENPGNGFTSDSVGTTIAINSGSTGDATLGSVTCHEKKMCSLPA